MLRNLLQLLILFCISQTFFNKHTIAQSHVQTDKALFSLLSSEQTGISFENKVPVYERMNVLISQYHYNGGGVAVGDINNDGLADIFFVQNFGPDKLYLNKGNLQFEDISEKAGIQGRMSWETGAVMVDVNHDGWTDIYVSRSGLLRARTIQICCISIREI